MLHHGRRGDGHISSRRNPCSWGRFLNLYSHHLFFFTLYHAFSCLWNGQKEEGDSGLQRAAALLPCITPQHRHCDTAGHCVAMPMPSHRPCVVAGCSRQGQGGGRNQQQQAPRAAGHLHTARTSRVAAWQARNQRHSPHHVSFHVQRNSPSYNTSEQHLIPSLISFLVWK